jgi:hypothetical protein
MTPRGRSLAAAMFGMLAVLASLIAGPGVAIAQPAVRSAIASTVRDVIPMGIGARETRDRTRALPRDASEKPPLAVAIERQTTAGHGPTPSAAVLAASASVPPAATSSIAVRDRPGQVCGRTPGTRRDRAPPQLAAA